MASLRIIFKGQTTTVVNSVRTESEKWVALSASSATFITLLLDFSLFLLSPAQTCRQSWRKSGLIKKKMIGLYAVAVLQVTQEITRNTVTKRKKHWKIVSRVLSETYTLEFLLAEWPSPRDRVSRKESRPP